MSETYTAHGVTVDQSQAASVTTKWVSRVGKKPGLCIQTDYGAVTGTITLQASTKDDDSLPGRDVSDVPIVAPAASPGGEVIVVDNARAPYYRLKYTHSSGTGALELSLHVEE